MIIYPRTSAERIDLRAMVLNRLVQEASFAARLHGLSLDCESAVRWDGPHACKNDGSTCLCSCHDPSEETS
jgi:hypothetical protein